MRMKINKLLKVLISLMILIGLCGCGFVREDIHIVFTSDIHGHANDGMGYEGLKSYVKSLKRVNSYVTLVDGGDFSQGEGIAKESKGQEIIDIMNDVGYDIATLGNHDFDYGLEALKDNIDKAKFDIVDCNIKYVGNGKDPFTKVKPYVIKKYGPVKVAYIGILTPETVFIENDSYKNCLEGGKLAYDLYHNPYESDGGDAVFARVQEVIDEARTKADYVVAVSHLGRNHESAMNAETLINFTRGIDIVLDSHAHTTEDTMWENIDGKEVLFFAVGKHFERIGEVIIKTDNTLEWKYVE